MADSGEPRTVTRSFGLAIRSPLSAGNEIAETVILLGLLLLLTLVPLMELALLIRLYQATDLGTTLAVVILTGIVGAALARRQGLETWYRIERRLSERQPPTAELMDGLMIFIAGALLITPGMMTDAVGFLLLIPPVRKLLRGWLARRLMPSGMQFYSFHSSPFSERPGNENEIEAEYTVEHEVESSKSESSPHNFGKLSD